MRSVSKFLSGFAFAMAVTCTQAATAPAASTGTASEITDISALMRGGVNPNGAATTVHFQYGTTVSYGNISYASPLGLDFQNQSVVVANPDVPASNSTYTVEAWIKPDSMGDRAIVSWGLVGAANRATALRLHGNGLYHYWWDNDLTANTGSLIGAWHHVAASFDGTTRRIFLDGVQVAQDTPGNVHTVPSSNFRIGSRSDGLGEFFDGEISEVRVWNTALSISTLQAWTNQVVTASHPNYANLKGYWPINQGYGTTITDLSPNGKPGEVTGTPLWEGESSPVLHVFLASKRVRGLTPNTTYHYRLVASNSVGVTYGGNQTFTTEGSYTFNVSNLNDSGPGSLRQALLAANDVTNQWRHSIINATGVSGTITMASAYPVLSNSFTLNGSGAANLTISGNNLHRPFFIDATDGQVFISGVTLADSRAKGGDGGLPAGGGGAGLGGALFVNQGNVTVSGVNFVNNQAIGGNGGNATSGYAGGGGGGLGGNGGSGLNGGWGGGGGGGFLGAGGSGNGSAGGGGGIVGKGGDGGYNGGGGGGTVDGQNGGSNPGNGGGGGGRGGDIDTDFHVGHPDGYPGDLYGGGGGAASHANGNGGTGGTGGAGGRFGGGGSGGYQRGGGNGGEFGGGGGAGWKTYWSTPGGGHGGFGGGGGAGLIHEQEVTGGMGAKGGNGGFGGGGGGAVTWSLNYAAVGGAFGGRGGTGNERNVYKFLGGGGGGAALGGSVFVRPGNGATITFIDSTVGVGSLTAGTGGSRLGDAYEGLPGEAHGSAVFLSGGETLFTVNSGIKTLAGSISDWDQSIGALRKSGAGTLVLTGTNNYRGNTLVSGGKLLLNGQHLNSPLYVTNGAVISGAGTAPSLNLTTGATLAPGDGVGKLTVSNMAAAGVIHYNWQVYDAVATAVQGYDQLVVNGTLNLSNVTTFNVNLESVANTNGTTGSAQNFNKGYAYSWVIVRTTGGILGFNAANFTVVSTAINGTAGFAHAFTPGVFSVRKVNNNLVLDYTPNQSPEAPSLPTATTLTATEIGSISAWLNGSVNPNGGLTQSYFEYGTTTSYGSMVPALDRASVLDFANNSVEVPSPDVPVGNSSYTMEAWIKPDSMGVKYILGWGEFGQNNRLNELRLSPDGIYHGWWGNDLSATTLGLVGQWHHVAASYDGVTRKIYLDGQIVAQDTPSGVHDMTSNNFRIGMSRPADTQYFDGKIAEVRVWDTAISQATLQAWMQQPLTIAHPNRFNLKGYWPMMEGSGNTINDNGTLGNHGTLAGTPNWTSDELLFSQSPNTLIRKLALSTTYHYRLVSSNITGVAYGQDLTFTTGPGAVYTVSNLNDSGAGSLRQALLDANTGTGFSTINATGVSGTIVMQSAYPVLSNSFTLSGPGAANLTISGSNSFRIFFIDSPDGVVTLNNVTLANGLAKGGNGGNPAGGGGAGLGGALFVNRGDVALSGVVFSNNAAVGGNGGSYVYRYGSGGGGGLGGNGGDGTVFTGSELGGGGGGGFLGNGGHGSNSAGGGGGIVGNGGNGGFGGGGGGGTVNGQNGGNPNAGAGGGGGGNGGDSGHLDGYAGSYYGGGGGARGSNSGGTGGIGGAGGRFGGGGGGGKQRGGGTAGEFGGGGGTGYDAWWNGGGGGAGGFGGGGGGGGNWEQGAGKAAYGGYGGFGGGGGGAATWSLSDASPGGVFGGRGGTGNERNTYKYVGGGGGGAALGGAVFVRIDQGATISFTDTSADNGNVVAGAGGASTGDGYAGAPGEAYGSALFLGSGTNLFAVSAGTKTIAGSISDWSQAPSTISKSGSGTLVLGGTNNYRGATLVNTGELRVNGALINSTAKLSSGTKLSGSGALKTAELASGATLAPGDGAGRLTVTNLTLSGAYQYNWQVLNAGGIAGVGYDQLLVSGALNLSNLTSLTINLETLPGNDFSSLNQYSWVILRATGGFLGLDLANFQLNLTAANGTAGFIKPYTPGSFRLRVDGNDVVLDFLPNLPPAITMLPGSSITATSAVLNASVNLRDTIGAGYFEYGLTTGYGALTMGATHDFQNQSMLVAAPDVPSSNSTYTIEAWIKPDTMSDQAIVAWGVVGQVNRANGLRLHSGGLWHYWWSNDLTVNTGSLVGAWHHVAASFDGTTRRIYLDGVQVAQDTPGNSHAAPSSNLRIGSRSDAVGEFFDGEITEVRVWATAVDVTNLAAWKDRYLTSAHPDYANLKGYWQLNEGSGTNIFDLSGNGNHGTLNGTPHWDGEAWQSRTDPKALISGLLPATTYHYRFVATNTVGTTYGNDIAFTTSDAAPYANTLGADEFTPFSARLVAQVRSNGEGTTVRFNWGTTTNYDAVSSNVVLPDAANYQAVLMMITNLSPATTYHYQVVASNALGVTAGTNRTFTTEPYTPYATTLGASGIQSFSAVLNGTVSPNGLPTVSYFEYGLTTSYGSAASGVTHDFQNQSVRVATPDVPLGNYTYTMEAWIKPDSMGDKAIIGWGPFGQVNKANALRLHNGGLWHYWWANDLWVNTPSLVGAWHHVAASFDGTYRRIFLNGVQVAQDTPGSGHDVTANDLRIGSASTGSNEFFDGEIAEVRVWATAVNATNLMAWKDKFLNADHPDYAALKGYWPLNEGSGTNIVDWSGKSNHGILTGTPHWDGEVRQSQTDLSLLVGGLLPGETYHYRLVATNSLGVTYGDDYTFITPAAAPYANTFGTDEVAPFSAQLQGEVRSNGEDTTVWFNYGTTTNYGMSSPVEELTDLSAYQTVGLTITNLAPNTTYYYQVVASNTLGVTVGSNRMFNTSPYAPYASTLAATDVQSFSAVLKGTVVSNGLPTVSYFEYGLTTSYGNTASLVVHDFQDQSVLVSAPEVPSSNSTYTIEAWIKPDTMGDRAIVSWGLTQSHRATGLRLHGGGLYHYWWDNDLAANTGSLIGAWHHVAASFDGTTRRIFLDGVQVAQDTPGNDHTVPSSHFRIGSRSDGVWEFFDGKIAEVRVWGTAVNVTNLVAWKDRFLNADHPDYASLNGYWLLNEGNGTNIVDWSGKGNHGTLNGTPHWGDELWSIPTQPRFIVTGLLPGETYHYRLVSSNSLGVAYGEDVSFLTASTAPSATTLAATDLAGQSATLNATVRPNGETTTVYFNYGATASYGLTTAPIELGATSGTHDINIDLVGLSVVTPYHFQVVASNSLGVVTGADLTFTTPALIPSATTLIANNVSATNAVMNGTVNPNGAATTVYFRYGETESYGQVLTTNLPAGVDAVSISLQTPLLAPATTYHYQLMASNVIGVTYGESLTLNTPVAAPAALTLAATGLAGRSATLNAEIGTGGESVWVYFNYGPTTSFGFTTPAMELSHQSGFQSFSALITNLNLVTTYHYEVVVSNQLAVASGGNRDFTTLALLPTAVALPASDVQSTNAVLNGAVNPNGAATMVYFHYGETESYGQVVMTNLSAGLTELPVSRLIDTLSPALTYHYQLVASNIAGLAYSADLTFTASNAAPSVVTQTATNLATRSVGLNALANPNGEVTTVWFNYGTTTDYGLTTEPVEIGSTPGSQSLTLIATNLAPFTVYHYQAVASNRLGVVTGVDLSFATLETPPTVVTLPASLVGATNATMNGAIVPNSTNAVSYFEYGLTTNYSSRSLDFGRTLDFQDNIIAVNSPNVPTGDSPYTVEVWIKPDTMGIKNIIAWGEYGPRNSITELRLDHNGLFFGWWGNDFSVTTGSLVGAWHHVAISYDGTVRRIFLDGVQIAQNTPGEVAAVTANNFRIGYSRPGAPQYFDGEMAEVRVWATAVNLTNLVAWKNRFLDEDHPDYAHLKGYWPLNEGSGTAIVDHSGNGNHGILSGTPRWDGEARGNPLNPSLALSGLLPATTYHYRLVATNHLGVTYGEDVAFITSDAAPYANTLAADELMAYSARLRAEVRPNGEDTTVWFNYGTTTSYGLTTPSEVLSGAGDYQQLSRTVSSLLPGMTYHVQVVASNSVGVTYGANRTFTLPSVLPEAETLAVTDIAGFSAVLNGEIHPGGADTTIYFHYGETTEYGSVITTNLPAGNSNVTVSLLAMNLSLFTTYHVQVVASNSVGMVSGGDVSFATLAAAPTLVTLAHENVTSTNAQLQASVNPNGAITTVYFNYGATTDYGQTTTPVTVGDGVEPQFSSAVVDGFLPVETVHYQVVVSNSVGVITGNASFTTLPALPLVTTLPATNVTAESAVLRGAVTTNDFNVTTYFEYGTTTNLGKVAQSFSRALDFRYDSTYASVVLADLSNFYEGGVPYTFELWFKPDRMGDQVLFRWAMEGGVALLLTDTGLMHTWGTAEEGVPPLRVETGSLVGQWHHAAVTYDGTQRTLYLDGNLVAQDTPEMDFDTLSAWYYEFTLGNDYSYNYPYDGAMMEVRVWAESLVAADIRAWMNRPLNSVHPRYEHIRAHWRLDTAINFRGYRFTDQIDAGNQAAYYTVYAGGPHNLFAPGFIDAPFAIGGYPNTFISGLEPVTDYFYRVAASNSVGVERGEILSFTTGAGLPIAGDLRAADITSSNAVLRAEILTRGAATTVYFQHGSTTNYGLVTTLSNFTHGASAQPIAVGVEGALPGMPYYFQIVASNSVGVVTGKASFAALPVLPTVVTLSPTNIAGFHAVLNAQVYSGGADTTVFFHYGTNTDYGQTLITNIPPGTATLDLSQLAEGLSLFTEYHVQVVASNRVGVVTGEDVAFATLGGIPAVTTLNSDGITTNSAVVYGSYDTHGADTVVYFNYGPTTSYGQSSIPAAVGDELGEQTYQTTLTNLAPGVVYHYQMAASNIFGVTVGGDATFTTLPMAPTVTTLPVSELKAHSVQLNGAVVLNDTDATSYFEYGTTTALGQTANFNRALKFPAYPGYRGYVRTPFSGWTNGTPYTFELWLKPDAMVNQTVFKFGFRFGLELKLTETGLSHGWGALSSVADLQVDTGSLTSSWHHVAISYDGTNRFTYLDGLKVAQDTPGSVYQLPNTQFYLGGDRFSVPYEGALTELRVWNKALDGTTLLDWINGSLSNAHPAYTNLACYWRLNGGGQTITDDSGNGRNGSHYLVSGSTEFAWSPNWTDGPVRMGTSPQAFLLGLVPLSTYHYRVVSSNSVGTVYGEILSFTTPAADPVRTTLAVSNLTSSSVTLNALVNANGTNTFVYFNYGVTTNYGFTTPLVDIGALVTNQNVSTSISGLMFATTYHVQIVASNALGVFPGNELTFITLPVAPTVTTLPASDITKFSVTMNGSVVPNGAPAFTRFEYGATTNYGNTANILDKSLDFQTQSVVVPNADVPLGNSHYTIEAWIKPRTAGDSAIVAWGSVGVQYQSTALRLLGDSLRHYWWAEDLDVHTGSLVGAWHHVAASYDGNARTIYLDGVQIAQDFPPANSHNTTAGDLRIGSNSQGDQEHFDGQIAEVRVWAAAINVTNLMAWKNRSLTASHPDYANLKGYWPLNEGLGTNIVDYSTNGNHGTLIGTAHWLADSPFDNTEPELLLSDLMPGNTYHYRLVSTNSAGTTYGQDQTFTTTYGYARSLGLERAANRTVKVSVAKLLAMVDDPDLDETLSLVGVEETTSNGATVYVDGNWVIYQPAVGFNDTDTFLFQVSDSRGAIAQGTVTVVIREEDNGQTRNLISVTVQTGGAMRIQAIGLPGRSYTLQATTNLTSPVWTTLGTREADANGLFEYTDPDAIHHTQRYYRAIPTP